MASCWGCYCLVEKRHKIESVEMSWEKVQKKISRARFVPLFVASTIIVHRQQGLHVTVVMAKQKSYRQNARKLGLGRWNKSSCSGINI